MFRYPQMSRKACQIRPVLSLRAGFKSGLQYRKPVEKVHQQTTAEDFPFLQTNYFHTRPSSVPKDYPKRAPNPNKERKLGSKIRKHVNELSSKNPFILLAIGPSELASLQDAVTEWEKNLNGMITVCLAVRLREMLNIVYFPPHTFSAFFI